MYRVVLCLRLRQVEPSNNWELTSILSLPIRKMSIRGRTVMGAPARIGLIADDDAYFRMAVGAILNRQFGFSHIIEAGSLDEALERLGENPTIGVALFDLSMPGMRTPTN